MNMPNLNLIRAFLEHASAQGSRSTALKPIGWMISICIAATLSSAYLATMPWLTILFAIFATLTMLLYLGAYIYCLITDKDALRSETYTIQKMAIEKGFVGDSLTGVLDLNQDTESRLIDSTAEVASEVNK